MSEAVRRGPCFLSRDNSGHWYLVPIAIAEEWERWQNLDEDDPVSWTAPEGAERIDNPSRLTILEYTIDE